MRHTRFEAVRQRLETFDPGSGWKLGLYEFLLFGFKQAWACLFGALLLALLLLTHFFYPDNAALHRYDFLTLAALVIQAGMLLFRLETWDEAKVILIFHVVGTVMELFKTAAGSWIYPEDSFLHVGAVPLFSGFMYASVGSYIARVWRIFDFRYSAYPPRWATYALAAAIYVNFSPTTGCRTSASSSSRSLLAVPQYQGPLPQLARAPLDAAAARLPSRRAVYLVRREHRHFRQRVELPGAGGLLGIGQPGKARQLVPADADQFRFGQPGADGETANRLRGIVNSCISGAKER
ncbi:hypothetical protein ED21_27338 [Erythrobacter sp. SD-21]|nr:hypothetical protein ED21_27338 [Erythrobacter sp. SD-21]